MILSVGVLHRQLGYFPFYVVLATIGFRLRLARLVFTSVHLGSFSVALGMTTSQLLSFSESHPHMS